MGDSRGEAQHTNVLPDVPTVDELRERQAGTRGGRRFRIELWGGADEQKRAGILVNMATSTVATANR